MTPKERAAMQQAIHVIEYFDTGSTIAEKTITALREALAEQAECKECGAKQAQIDRLMLEYCPDEMTPEQMQEWGNNQRPAEQAEQEPVARVTGYYGGRCVVEPLNRATVLPTDMALYAAPVQQVTRADLKAAFKEGFERAADLYAPNDGQEPYAYEVWDANDQVLILIYASCLKEFHWIEQDDIARVLYAAPVRTKDLADDELASACGWKLGDPMYEWVVDIGRWAIAADREKNK